MTSTKQSHGSSDINVPNKDGTHIYMYLRQLFHVIKAKLSKYLSS